MITGVYYTGQSRPPPAPSPPDPPPPTARSHGSRPVWSRRFTFLFISRISSLFISFCSCVRRINCFLLAVLCICGFFFIGPLLSIHQFPNESLFAAIIELLVFFMVSFLLTSFAKKVFGVVVEKIRMMDHCETINDKKKHKVLAMLNKLLETWSQNRIVVCL